MRSGSRWLGLSGAVFVVVAFLGLSAVGDTPEIADSTASEIVDHWLEVANGELSSALLVLCVPLLLIFGGVVLDRHRIAISGFDVWAFLFGTGLAIAAVGLITEAAGVAAISDVADSGFSDLVVDVYVGGTRVHMIWAVGLSIALLGAAGIFIPRAGVHRLLGWFALVGGIAGLIPEPFGFVGVPIAVLWIFATSIVITIRPE